MAGDRVCGIEGCGKEEYFKTGVCNMHYQRKRRTGLYEKADYSIQDMRFGRVVVVGKHGSDKHNTFWRYRCDCGSVKVARRSHLVGGSIKSCGCASLEKLTTHGGSKSKTYRVWADMKNRCENENNTSYPRYGGKGIAVCSRWQDYEKFLKDMGERPYGMEIDRIDSSKGYSPDNCRWANDVLQSRNRKYAKIGVDGAMLARKLNSDGMSYTDIAELFGCSRVAISNAVTGRTYSGDEIEVRNGVKPEE